MVLKANGRALVRKVRKIAAPSEYKPYRGKAEHLLSGFPVGNYMYDPGYDTLLRNKPILCKDLAEAEAHCVTFNMKHGGAANRGCIVDKLDGQIWFHPRDRQPCIGFMRPYQETKESANEYYPSDLYDPFPRGEIVMFQMGGPYSTDQAQFLLHNPMSPYRKIARYCKPVMKGDKQIGFILTETSVNADELAWMCSQLRWNYSSKGLKDPDPDTALAHWFLNNTKDLYGNGKPISLRKLVRADAESPIGTFRDRAAYRRRVIEQTWHSDTAPKENKDLKTLEQVIAKIKEIKEKENIRT